MRPTLQLRRYVAGDAALITPRSALQAEVEVIGEDLLKGAVPDGPAYTATEAGQPIACAGLMPIWPGRWVAWSWVGPVRPRVWRWIYERALASLDATIGHSAVHGSPLRIEATARAEGVHAWLTKLGFVREGVMRAYDPAGADHILYARTFKPGDRLL